MAAQHPKPSVVAAKHFDVEKDSQTLRDAMKGLGTDEDTIIEIICARNYEQLMDIKKSFQQMFGRVLIDDLKSELGGKFEKVILCIMKSPAEQNAANLRSAVKGMGTDETAIIEVMCTSTNEELAEVKAAYKKAFDHDLMKDLVDDTSGDFKRLLVSMSAGDRDQDGAPLDDGEVHKLAQKLYDAGEGKIGTDEEAFNMVMGRRGFHQLKQIFDVYNRHLSPEKGIIGAIKSEFSGSIKEAYLAIATTALDGREAYFADKLYESMKGLGTNDNQLIRVITSRSQVDLKGVAVQFLKRHEKTLEDFVVHDTSGDYGKCLLALVKGNVHF
ncbi:annexin A13-like [Convolutriloba macropyga]|uniref:annexin A13-like n=1 Tax=Convolutriloba macropyga TaxID=536237 RepID=UPI003F52133D